MLLAFNWTDIGLPATQPMAVRDLFLKQDLGTFAGNFTGFVNPDGVLMLRLSKAKVGISSRRLSA